MADTKKHSASIPSLTDERYERTDARLSAVIIVSLLLVAAAVMSAVAVWYYYAFALAKLKHRQSQMTAPGKPAEIPANMPKLQIDSRIDLALFQAEQKKQLESYGWVSREAQVVRIPIERAIELTLERKLPSASTDVTTGTAPDNGADLPQDSSSGRTFWSLTGASKKHDAGAEETSGTATTDKVTPRQQHAGSHGESHG